jgi:hypothetical protein
MLLLASALKLIAETALLALVGRGVLGWMAGARREGNVFYQLLAVLAAPSLKAARWLAPKSVPDRHLPWLAALLLALIWLAALAWKVDACLAQGCLGPRPV